MKNSWLIVGAVAGGLFGVTVGACGQRSTPTGASGAGGSSEHGAVVSSSSSGSGSGGTGPSTSASTGTTSSGAGGAGGGVLCSKVTKLHPPKADAGTDTVYCPFSAKVDGGKNVYCKNENDPMPEHCCQPNGMGLPPAECVPVATTCPKAIPMGGSKLLDWGCEDPADCQAGEVCCSNAEASIGIGMVVNGMQCGNYAHHFTGTSCVKPDMGGCPAGAGILICTSDAECPKNMKCTPFGKGGNQLGGCM